jgi:uncharacterized protein (TIGR02217 family)
MPTLITFDNILLNPLYSNFAKGGAEYVTGISRSPHSGVAYAIIHRFDGQWRGEIDYALMEEPELEDLNEFFRGGFGRGIGFRFAPPYDYRLIDEVQYSADGRTSFKIYKTYSRRGSSIVDVKRIVLPVGAGLYMDDAVTPRANTVVVKVNGVVKPANTYSVNTTTVDATLGEVTWASGQAPATGIVTVSCEFDLPMMFDMDHFNAAVDETTVSELTGIPIVEIMPAALSIPY